MSMVAALRTGTTMRIGCADVVFVQSRLAINNELSITLCGFGAKFCFFVFLLSLNMVVF